MSVATLPRSSVWAPSLVRWNHRSPEAQRARVSQLPTVPSAVRPRISTCTQVWRGVVADQEAMSSVSANPGSVQGVAHRPNW